MKITRIAAALCTAAIVALPASSALAKPGPPGFTGRGEITLGIGNSSWCLASKLNKIDKRGNPKLYLVPCSESGFFRNWIVVRYEGIAEIQLLSNPAICVGMNNNDTNAVLVNCSHENVHGFPLRLGPGNGTNIFKIAYLTWGNTLTVSDPRHKRVAVRQVFWGGRAHEGFIQQWRFPKMHKVGPNL